jgi:hypothetical protein
LTFYGQHRSIFVRLIFPAVFLTTAAYLFRRHEVFEIQRHLLHATAILQYKMQLLEIGLVTWGSLLFSWLVFSLSFGAICVATERIQAGRGCAFVESFEVVSNRLPAFLSLCLFLFAAFVICLGTLQLVLQTLLWKVRGRDLGSFAIWVLSYSVFGVGALLCSRFSLSVPALILDDYNLGAAVICSKGVTRGKWPILPVLLFKSVAGGYIAGMLPFWLARFIPATVQLPAGFGWFLTAASVALVTLVEPLMFIGFALLYLKTAPVPATREVQVVSA